MNQRSVGVSHTTELEYAECGQRPIVAVWITSQDGQAVHCLLTVDGAYRLEEQIKAARIAVDPLEQRFKAARERQRGSYGLAHPSDARQVAPDADWG